MSPELTPEQFATLPLVIEGESKEIRYTGLGQVAIRLKPTVYSYTHNRAGEVAGSDTARLQSIKKFHELFLAHDVPHAYREVTDHFIIADYIRQPEGGYEPADMTSSEFASLHVAPPIEVVVKKVHAGTPKHRYYDMARFHVRHDHPEFAGESIVADEAYPETLVRFDWRNPMHDTEGNRLADEVLSEQMADWFINAKVAGQTALRAFTVLSDRLSARGLDLWDICFFITEDGTTLFGEVSPDCMRVRAADGSSLDKDIWRAGGSSENMLAKWQSFSELL